MMINRDFKPDFTKIFTNCRFFPFCIYYFFVLRSAKTSCPTFCLTVFGKRPIWVAERVPYASSRRVRLWNIHSWTCVHSSAFTAPSPARSLRKKANIYIRTYILGQSPVSSAAPHLILPIIANFNQRRAFFILFLLMNRSHVNVESRRRRSSWAHTSLPSGNRCARKGRGNIEAPLGDGYDKGRGKKRGWATFPVAFCRVGECNTRTLFRGGHPRGRAGRIWERSEVILRCRVSFYLIACLSV